MKKWIVLGAIFASSQAFAVCVTQSHGLSFYDSSYDTNTASYRTVSQCQANRYTSNSECSQNLRCDYYQPVPYPSGQVACSSQSRGLQFRQTSSDVNTASTGAVDQCQRNLYTSNSECVASLYCTDAGYGGGYPQSVSCTTSSRGLIFNRLGTDTNSVSQGVVSECTSNPYTSNSECQSNLSCNFMSGGPTPPPGPYPQPPYPQPYPPNPQPYPPNPYPQPYPPQPYPPYPRPEPYPRPDPRPPGGQVVCSVTTNRTTYTGSGFSEGQATAAARDACLGSETSFACNAGSVVCRGR